MRINPAYVPLMIAGVVLLLYGLAHWRLWDVTGVTLLIAGVTEVIRSRDTLRLWSGWAVIAAGFAAVNW